MSTTLEDQLILALIDKYIKEGKNVQKILDNPLFQGLPLDKKVAAIEDYKNKLSINPSFSLAPIIRGSVFGGLAGASGLATRSAMMRLKLPSSHFMAAAGLGAVLGGVIPAITSYRSYKNDKATQSNLSSNKYLGALVDRSTFNPSSNNAQLIKAVTDNINDKGQKFIMRIPVPKSQQVPQG